MAVTFLCLFRGPSIESAQLVSTSTDPELVRQVAADMLQTELTDEEYSDPARRALSRGKRQALRVIHGETEGAHDA
jgi:hypothetical protein